MISFKEWIWDTMNRMELCGRRGDIENQRYIAYGWVANEGQFPWMAHLEQPVGKCGASIISREWLLTAKHCVVTNKTGVVKKLKPRLETCVLVLTNNSIKEWLNWCKHSINFGGSFLFDWIQIKKEQSDLYHYREFYFQLH